MRGIWTPVWFISNGQVLVLVFRWPRAWRGRLRRVFTLNSRAALGALRLINRLRVLTGANTAW